MAWLVSKNTKKARKKLGSGWLGDPLAWLGPNPTLMFEKKYKDEMGVVGMD